MLIGLHYTFWVIIKNIKVYSSDKLHLKLCGKFVFSCFVQYSILQNSQIAPIAIIKCNILLYTVINFDLQLKIVTPVHLRVGTVINV